MSMPPTDEDEFYHADLIGLPWRIVVSTKTLKDGECEFKRRASKDAVRWELAEVPARLKELKAEIK